MITNTGGVVVKVMLCFMMWTTAISPKRSITHNLLALFVLFALLMALEAVEPDKFQ